MSPRRSSLAAVQNLRELPDWHALVARAERNGLLAQLAERLSDVNSPAPPEILDRIRDAQRRQAILALSLTAEMIRVLRQIESLGIEALVTKGPVLSVRCYGDPGKRPYADIDLVARDKDMRGATEAMIALGYAPRVPLSAIEASKFPGEYAFRKAETQTLVEFHTERTFRYHPRRLPIEKVFERRTLVSVDGCDIPALSVEDELVLICIHGAKHFWEKLMWIADVAALISRFGAVDWTRANESAREVGAERILRLGLRLAMDVCGAELPQHVAAEVRGDALVTGLAAKIIHRLETGEETSMGILARAAFRVKMRGGWIDGAAYLARLAFSATEEDWVDAGSQRSWLVDALGRPLRLARKHGRNSGA